MDKPTPEVELPDTPEPHYTTCDIKQAHRFATREEAEAVLAKLGPGYQLIEVPDEEKPVMARGRKPSQKPREREVFRETYRKGAVRLSEDALPLLRHISDGGRQFAAAECYVLAVGVIERDGQTLEYHDLRVFLKPEE